MRGPGSLFQMEDLLPLLWEMFSETKHSHMERSEVRMWVDSPGVTMEAVTCPFAELVNEVQMGQLWPLNYAAFPSQLHGELLSDSLLIKKIG